MNLLISPPFFVNSIGDYNENYTRSVIDKIGAGGNPIWGSSTCHKGFIQNGDNFIFLKANKSTRPANRNPSGIVALMKVRQINFRSSDDRQLLSNETIGWRGGKPYDFMWVVNEFYTTDDNMIILGKRRSLQNTFEKINESNSIDFYSEIIPLIRRLIQNRIHV
jgi:hypothetical protein